MASLVGLLRVGEVVIAAARAQAVADSVALAEAQSDVVGVDLVSLVSRANGGSTESGTNAGLAWSIAVSHGIPGSSRATAPTP
jgi:hypothetical protein